jgi:hypothetical protein
MCDARAPPLELSLSSRAMRSRSTFLAAAAAPPFPLAVLAVALPTAIQNAKGAEVTTTFHEHETNLRQAHMPLPYTPLSLHHIMLLATR